MKKKNSGAACGFGSRSWLYHRRHSCVVDG